MATPRSALPSFHDPPVVEVSLSAQFEPLVRLRSPHLGLFWALIRDEFPAAEERAPLPPAIEVFGAPSKEEGLRVEVLQVPPVARCWYLHRNGSELVQLQQDRFAVNWRKNPPNTAYPRYEHVREIFQSMFAKFEAFARSEKLGDFVFTQCEVTYVNHFLAGIGWERPGQLGELVTVWVPQYTDEFLSEPEDVRFNIRYLIKGSSGEALGRLQIGLEPKYGEEARPSMMVMIMNARLKPFGNDLGAVISALDEGRRWIVRGFTSITNSKMHQMWRRYDNL